MAGWLADLLAFWLTNWLDDRYIGWLADSLAGWLIHWPTGLLTHWLAARLADSFTSGLVGWLAESLTCGSADWLAHWLAGVLTTDWLADWLSVSLYQYRLSSSLSVVSRSEHDPQSYTGKIPSMYMIPTHTQPWHDSGSIYSVHGQARKHIPGNH